MSFSTKRRIIGRFDINITMFETLISGNQELLKKEDLSNLIEWGPSD